MLLMAVKSAVRLVRLVGTSSARGRVTASLRPVFVSGRQCGKPMVFESTGVRALRDLNLLYEGPPSTERVEEAILDSLATGSAVVLIGPRDDTSTAASQDDSFYMEVKDVRIEYRVSGPLFAPAPEGRFGCTIRTPNGIHEATAYCPVCYPPNPNLVTDVGRSWFDKIADSVAASADVAVEI